MHIPHWAFWVIGLTLVYVLRHVIVMLAAGVCGFFMDLIGECYQATHEPHREN